MKNKDMCFCVGGISQAVKFFQDTISNLKTKLLNAVFIMK